MRKSPLFRAAVLLATLSPPAAHALTPEELFEKVSPSIFVIWYGVVRCMDIKSSLSGKGAA